MNNNIFEFPIELPQGKGVLTILAEDELEARVLVMEKIQSFVKKLNKQEEEREKKLDKK